jgi:hypothetical protein
MQQVFRSLLVVLAFLALAAIGQAQFGERNGRYRPESVSALMDRIHEDLNRGYSAWHLTSNDIRRLTHAERQLLDFAKHWRDGKFDKDDLDDAISAVQHVADSNHLQGTERDALFNDVAQLRQMREAYNRHEIGYRR